ncbi:MAG TPA: DNA-processing protein DprA [Acidobacteriota bacterium]|nr:DNA-processing protein DprA [Acidobacteriota bacterium]
MPERGTGKRNAVISEILPLSAKQFITAIIMRPADKNRIVHAIEATLVPGMGSRIRNHLLKTIPDISELFSMGSRTLDSLGIPRETQAAIRSRAMKENAAEVFDRAIHEDFSFLVYRDAGYPPLLGEIYDPPLVLYARGQLDILTRTCLAVVGARNPTAYGLHVAQAIAADLGSRGMTVVSGLARGIDAAAHRGCVEAKGTTVAVLGCGIDIVYPREHKRLAETIGRKGLLLSEFIPGTPPAPHNFPARNRIISGLSAGTLIIEATENSGSLITARLAMEQNREVYAVPGNITSPQSRGPNFLIKQGAKLVQTWKDIVEELPPAMRNGIAIADDPIPPAGPETSTLSDSAIRLLELLKVDEAIHFDMIYRRGGFSVSELSELLFGLETGGRIRQLPGNLYVKV